MTLGEKIQALRKQKGLSQEQLSEMISVTRQAVSKWELNESSPDLDNIVQLSGIFDVSIDYLLKGGDGRVAPVYGDNASNAAKQSESDTKNRKKLKCFIYAGVIFGIALILYQLMVVPASPIRMAFGHLALQMSWLVFVVAGVVSLLVCWGIINKK